MKKKQDTITFKVDEDLAGAIRDIPNRSEFIRSAILEALGGVCPLCNGSGILSPNQKRHWEEFSADHHVKKCEECHEAMIVCLSAQ